MDKLEPIQWRSHPTLAGVRLGQRLQPGYDCREKCVHEVKGNHGVHGDEWHYYVTDGQVALALEMFPPFGVPPVLRIGCGALYVCTAFPTTEPQIRGVDEPPRAGCMLLERPCYEAGIWHGLADEFWGKFGSFGAFEQLERFWTAMTLRFEGERKKAFESRDVLHQCPTCLGRGVIEGG